MKDFKQLIFHQIERIINERIESTLKSISLARESRDSETKSTAGDKYETGRAMVQFELEKHNIQLQKAQHQKHELSQINLQKKFEQVEFGSLVLTNEGKYFFSIALGKIEIDGDEIFCLSLASPIGKAFYNKETDNKIIFQGKEIAISGIF